jgi:molybdenum cofactor biosynthesis protein A
MPEEGINYLPKEHLLTYEELFRVVQIFTQLGIDKIRITGGEPFVRKDLIHLIESISDLEQLKKISLTTNGILTLPYLSDLKKFGINQINLSLDSVNAENFKRITRRDEFVKVMKTFYQMLDMGFEVKINAVIMDGINDHEIIDLAKLAIQHPVSVRFIEEMPFNGSAKKHKSIKWNYKAMIEVLKSEFKDLQKIRTPENSTSENYTFDNAKGDIGIIAAYSRTFCGTCDRIRLTSTGELRTCLYGHNVLKIKDLIRSGKSNDEIESEIIRVVQMRTKDGFEAEKLRGNKNPIQESMSVIGG